MLLLAFTISGCTSVSSTKALLETPKIDNIVIRVAPTSYLFYYYSYKTDDTKETLKKRAIKDAKTFLKELAVYLPKEMSRIVGTQPGQTRFIHLSEVDDKKGETNGTLWLKHDRLELTCMEYSKRCIAEKSELRTSLVYESKPSWESSLNVTVGANFSGSANDEVTMRKMAKKLVDQLASDGFIAQPFGN